MELITPKAILFDWDNTLVNTWPTIHESLAKTFISYGKTPWTFEETKLKVGKSIRDAFPALFGDEWEAAADDYIANFKAIHLQQLDPLPDVLPVLEYCKHAAPFIGVVSNKRGENLRKEAHHIGWEHYFDVLVGANDAPRDKPYADPAAYALKDSGIAMGAEVWFVGDTITDLGCAQEGGMLAILYGDVEGAENNTYLDYPYAAHVRNHKELLELLKKFC
jgi:phosphoglycolate phosphatase